MPGSTISSLFNDIIPPMTNDKIYSQERSISSAYIDSVLPDSMGELSEEYLQKMKEVWY